MPQANAAQRALRAKRSVVTKSASWSEERDKTKGIGEPNGNSVGAKEHKMLQLLSTY